MKFGNLLKSAGEHDPQLLDIFKFYKRLKKDLKFCGPADDANSEPSSLHDGNADEVPEPSTSNGAALINPEAFLAKLQKNVDDLRASCMEREENAIIKLEQLQHSSEEALSSGNTTQQQEVYQRLLNLHGELLLLLHWGMMVYTATTKILKKRAKQTGEQLDGQDAMFDEPLCAMDVRIDCWYLVSPACTPTQTVTDMIAKVDDLLAPLSVALGHPSRAPPPATQRATEKRQLCKVPTTQSEATGGAMTDAATKPAEERGSATRGRKRTREDFDMQALVAKAAEAAAAAEAVIAAQVAGDEEGDDEEADDEGCALEETAPPDPKVDSEDKMRATHAALDMWRTLVTNAKTPTSFPKDDPVRSFNASS